MIVGGLGLRSRHDAIADGCLQRAPAGDRRLSATKEGAMATPPRSGMMMEMVRARGELRSQIMRG
ncbi:MAG TPA: hypothetical protein DC054_11855 [Blastocatellia bacterium]|nr:hypothetical protein [Blastocatellia bacterium]